MKKIEIKIIFVYFFIQIFMNQEQTLKMQFDKNCRCDVEARVSHKLLALLNSD